LRIGEEVTLFLNHFEQKGYSENTRKMYCRNLGMYYEWLDYRGIEYLNVTRRNSVDFIDCLNIIQEEVDTNPIKTSDGDSGFLQWIIGSKL